MNEATYKVANELVPKVADEAANRAISSYIQAANSVPANPVPSGLNIVDRKGVTLSQQEYERIRREAAGLGINENQGNMMSLGRRFEDALNQKLNDEVIGSLVGKMFGGNSSSPSPGNASAGMVGGVLHELKGILDTKFGYGLGEKLGGSATELIKTIGQERVGQLIDNYNQNLNPNSQQPQQPQLTPEEQQKRAESTIMSFDSTNISDMTKFMEATGIRSLPDAQKLLLSEQDRILQSRGLTRTNSPHQTSQQSAEFSTPNENPRTKDRSRSNKPNDMNRDLIDRYDNPDQFSQGNQPFSSDNFNPPRNDFFSIGNPDSSPNLALQQTPEERILSFNPDDPTSLHQYASMRNISGVDASTIKKMLIQEQRNLMSKSSNSTQNSISSSSIDAQNKNSQGISPDEDQARLRGGTNSNEFPVQIPTKLQEQQTLQEQQMQQPPQQLSDNTQNNSSNSTSDTSDSSSSMDTIMRVLNKLDEKIDYLESEIITLKSNTIKSASFTEISPSEEQTTILKSVNVDNLIKKAPRIATFNKTSKNSEINKDLKDSIQTNTEENSEMLSNIINSQNEITPNINESETKGESINSDQPKDLDWFGERSKIINDIKSEVKKEREIKENKEREIEEIKEHKKFTIKRR